MNSNDATQQLEEIALTAAALFQSGKFQQAIEPQKVACKLTEQVFGKESAESARSFGFLGLIYKSAGVFDRAEESYLHAIDVLNRIQGDDSPELGTHLSNLGVLYKRQDRFKEAKQLYERSLVNRRAYYPEQSAEVINGTSNLATLLEAMGKTDEALALYMSAFESARALADNTEAILIACLNNLGNFYFERGELHLSEPLLREALEYATKIMPADHPKLLIMQASFGRLLVAMERYREAVKLLPAVSVSLTKLLGEEHPATKVALAALESATQNFNDNSTPETANSMEKGNESITIEFDLSGIDGLFQPRVKEALTALFETDNEHAVLRLIEDHPELRARLTTVLEQYQSARKSGPGAELNRVVNEFCSTDNVDERVRLCRTALSLIERETQPAVWFDWQKDLGVLLFQPGAHDAADKIEQAIEAMRTALELKSPEVPGTKRAVTLSILAMFYRARLRGNPDENLENAIDAYEQALRIPEHQTEPQSYAATQNNLANAYVSRRTGRRDDDLSKAVLLFLQVLRVNTRDVAPVEWARTQNNLGNAYLKFEHQNAAQNRERAIKAFEEALTVRTQEAMPDKWAETMTNLGNAWRARIDGDRTENLRKGRTSYGEALSVWTGTAAPEHHRFTLEMLALACLEDRHWRQFGIGAGLAADLLLPLTDEELAGLVNEYPEIAPLRQERERLSGGTMEAPPVRNLQIARSLIALFQIERAEARRQFLELHPELRDASVDSLFERVQQKVGADETGTVLSMLEEKALLSRLRMRGIDAAINDQFVLEQLEDRADDLIRNLQEHPPSAADALDRLQEAITADDAVIGPLSRNGSPRIRQRYFSRLRDRMDTLLSLALMFQHYSPFAVKLCLQVVLRRKGLEAELSINQRDLAGELGDPRVVQVWSELNNLRRSIAEKILAIAEGQDAPTYDRALLDLHLKEETLEYELAELSPSARIEARLETVTYEAVARVLPPGAALIEFVRVNLGLPGNRKGRYLALVLTSVMPDQPTVVDLGDADAIDEKIRSVRSALTNDVSREIGRLSPGVSNIRSPFGAASQAVRAAIFDPIHVHLHGSQQLYVSPDGDLSLLPLEILSDGLDHYLIDDFSFRYLTSGRELIHITSTPRLQASSPALVLANPDYDWRGSVEEAPSGMSVFFFEDIIHLPGQKTPEDHRLENPHLRFKSLDGAGAEGKSVAAALGVQALLAADATKTVVLQSKSPRILHLATHGFFLEDLGVEPLDKPGATVAHRLGMRLVPRQGAAAMRSWLVFAGVNRWLHHLTVPKEAGNCILTGADAATLSLLGTELVVLSACESGLGVVRAGEGVLGLRRAFAMAGARTIIMSLWRVADAETGEMMSEFYRKLLAGEGRADALRSAQLAMKKKYPHPLLWGGFICEGDWRPLEVHDMT